MPASQLELQKWVRHRTCPWRTQEIKTGKPITIGKCYNKGHVQTAKGAEISQHTKEEEESLWIWLLKDE